MTEAVVEARTPGLSRANDCVALEDYTAELGSRRLLADIDSNRLNTRTKIVYSCILYEFYLYILRVQEKEPGTYGECYQEKRQNTQNISSLIRNSPKSVRFWRWELCFYEMECRMTECSVIKQVSGPIMICLSSLITFSAF